MAVKRKKRSVAKIRRNRNTLVRMSNRIATVENSLMAPHKLVWTMGGSNQRLWEAGFVVAKGWGAPWFSQEDRIGLFG